MKELSQYTLFSWYSAKKEDRFEFMVGDVFYTMYKTSDGYMVCQKEEVDNYYKNKGIILSYGYGYERSI